MEKKKKKLSPSPSPPDFSAFFTMMINSQYLDVRAISNADDSLSLEEDAAALEEKKEEKKRRRFGKNWKKLEKNFKLTVIFFLFFFFHFSLLLSFFFSPPLHPGCKRGWLQRYLREPFMARDTPPLRILLMEGLSNFLSTISSSFSSCSFFPSPLQAGCHWRS